MQPLIIILKIIKTLLAILSFISAGFLPVYFFYYCLPKISKINKVRETNKINSLYYLNLNNKNLNNINNKLNDEKLPEAFGDISTGINQSYYNSFSNKGDDNNISNNFINSNLAKKIFILFLSFYVGIYLTNAYLISLSLLNLKYNFLLVFSFSIIFFIIFLAIIIYEFAVYRLQKKLQKQTVLPETDLPKTALPKESPKQLPKQIQLSKQLQKQAFFTKKFQAFKLQSLQIKKLKISFTSLTSLASLIFVILIAINFFIVSFFTFLFPIKYWDAISCWSLKAKAFFIDLQIQPFYLNHNYSFSQNSYPLYLPLAQTWIYLWISKVDETIVKIIFPIFYISLIYFIHFLFRKKMSKFYSVIFAFIISSLPIVIDHGYIEYTNLLFSIILFLAVYFLYSFFTKLENRNVTENNIENNSLGDFCIFCCNRFSANSFCSNPFSVNSLGNLYLSSIFFAILAQIRSEGFIFLVIFLTVIFVLIINKLIKWPFLNKNKSSFQSKNNSNFQSKDNSILKSKKKSNLQTENNRNFQLKNKSNLQTSFPTSYFFKFKESFLFLFLYYLLFYLIIPTLLSFAVMCPWLFLKSKLGLPSLSFEWQKLISNFVNDSHNSNNSLLLANFWTADFSLALKTFISEIFYSISDSTRGFFGSFYGIIWVALLILFFINIKKMFIKFNWIFFLFIFTGLFLVFVSFLFIEEFSWSIERYILHYLPLTYFYILYNLPMFKNKNSL